MNNKIVNKFYLEILMVLLVCLFLYCINIFAGNIDENIYNDVIKSIEDSIDIYDPSDTTMSIGVTNYIGHQLYDIDNDGMSELFVFRSAAYGKIYIDSAYRIVDEKVETISLSQFGAIEADKYYSDIMITNYKTGGTRDDVFYALTDGRVARFTYHWGGIDGAIIYDFKNNTLLSYDYDVTSDNKWSKNGNKMLDATADVELDEILRKVGTFSAKMLDKSQYLNNNMDKQNPNAGDGSLNTSFDSDRTSKKQVIVTSDEIDSIYYVDDGDNTRVVVNFNEIGSKKIEDGTKRNLNKYLYIVSGDEYMIEVKVDKVVSSGIATVYLPSIYRNYFTKSAIESVNNKEIFASIVEDSSRKPTESSVGTMTENVDDIKELKDTTSQGINGVINGLPSRESELRRDNYFYLDDNLQRNTWVYYRTYYYHVDENGNIQKNQWIDLRYVGADGRMYRGTVTPDGKWVGDDGLVVDIDSDLSKSLMAESAEPDSWYQAQSGFWYYFENDRTKTRKGWFTDSRDDQTYYLDPDTGIMSVGWRMIDGKLYYFNESHANVPNWYEIGEGFYESYGKKIKSYGSMFRNEVTPDGRLVDSKGILIEGSSVRQMGIVYDNFDTLNYDYSKPPIYKNSQIVIGKRDILSAIEVSYNDEFGKKIYGVDAKLTEHGKQKLIEATERNKGKLLYIIYNGKIISTPYIQSTIGNGEIRLANGFTSDEAKGIAACLNLLNANVTYDVVSRKDIESLVTFTISSKQKIKNLIQGVMYRMRDKASDYTKDYKVTKKLFSSSIVTCKLPNIHNLDMFINDIKSEDELFIVEGELSWPILGTK